MSIGFHCFNFTVIKALRGSLEEIKKACEGDHGNIVFLENRDKLKEVPIEYLVGIYRYFTGNVMRKPEPGQEAAWKADSIPIIRVSFDDSKVIDAKKYKPEKKAVSAAPVSHTEEEADTQPTKQTPKSKGGNNAKPTKSAQPKETEDMATKKTAAKKTAGKKTAAKKPAAAKSGAGRKSLFGDTAKIKSLTKENPRRAGTHGHKSMEIIIKNPGITVADFVKKGGRLNDLRWDVEHKSVSVSG